MMSGVDGEYTCPADGEVVDAGALGVDAYGMKYPPLWSQRQQTSCDGLSSR